MSSEIAVLAEDYETKWQRMEMLRMVNVAGMSSEDRIKQSVEYHQAEADLMKAHRMLTLAKKRFAAES